jgi:hypothetical protein
MAFLHRHCGGTHARVTEARDCEANTDAVKTEERPKRYGKGPRPPQPIAATQPQLKKIRALLMYRNLPQVYADRVQEYLDGNKFSFKGASLTIDRLLAFPEKPNFRQPDQNIVPRPNITEGVYRVPDTGELWVVRHPINKPDGNLYASILIIREQPEFDASGKITRPAKVGFEYVKGGIRTLHESWRLTEAEAIAWGRMYGVCSKCGSELSKEESIERGMGDICAAKQWGA